MGLFCIFLLVFASFLLNILKLVKIFDACTGILKRKGIVLNVFKFIFNNKKFAHLRGS